MRKYARLLLCFAIGLPLLAVGAVFVLYLATQHEPEFYQQALRAAPEVQEEAGDELERNVLELHNEVRRDGRWEAIFTDEQINGWLAVDLPNKFADTLPKAVSEPRVAITAEQILIACRYQENSFSSVLSLGLDVGLTDEPNVLAVRLRKARAGMLPLPLGQILKDIEKTVRSSDWSLRWAQEEGDPVAIVTPPLEGEDREIVVDTLELRDGSLRISGRTGGDMAAAYFNVPSMLESIVEKTARHESSRRARSNSHRSRRPSSSTRHTSSSERSTRHSP